MGGLPGGGKSLNLYQEPGGRLVGSGCFPSSHHWMAYRGLPRSKHSDQERNQLREIKSLGTVRDFLCSSQLGAHGVKGIAACFALIRNHITFMLTTVETRLL